LELFPSEGSYMEKMKMLWKGMENIIQKRNIFLMLGAITIIGFCIYQLIGIYFSYKKADDEYAEIEQKYVIEIDSEQEIVGEDIEKIENPVDFAGLKNQNEDVVGWLKIDGIKLSYPIMQSVDNEYYLNHTFQKNTHFAGSIFMDCENSPDFSDYNIILYGHNMKNGSMFGSLKKYQSKEFFAQNPFFWIYTPEKIYKYKVFSCREVSIHSGSYQIQFEDRKDFSSYIYDAAKASFVKHDIPSYEKDAIVTLSTCTNNSSNRFIVQGLCVQINE